MGGDRVGALNRQIWLRMILAGLLLDVALVWGVVWVSTPAYSEIELMSVVVGVAALWAISLVLAIKNFLAGLLAAYFQDSLVQSSFLEILRNMKVPPPKPFYPARFDYLEQVAEDGGQDVNDRLRAMALYSTWSGVMRAKGVIATLNMTRAWDSAVQRYNDESPTP